MNGQLLQLLFVIQENRLAWESVIIYEDLINSYTQAKQYYEDVKKYAEEAKKNAENYIPYSFGRFRIDENSNLVADYYGNPDDDDIKFNENGDVILYVKNAPKVNIGRGRLVFINKEYSPNKLYKFYDCVKYKGEWWLHIGQDETIGFAPIEGDVWTLFGAKGEKGDRGERGIQGEQGVQGEEGPQGKQGVQGKQGIQGVKGDSITNVKIDAHGHLIITVGD